MNESGRTSDIVARQVKEALTGEQTAPSPVTGPSVRLAAQKAAAGARSLGRGAEHLAREVVEGTVRAAGEITGETTTIIRDAVIGAVEGTEQVVRVSSLAVRESVVGAVRGSGVMDAGVTVAGRNAVEGAISGATSVGISSTEAATAAADGALEAMVEAGEEVDDAARAAMTGVVSGVSAAGGNVADAVRQSAAALVGRAADADESASGVEDIAQGLLETVLIETESSGSDAEEIAGAVSAAAAGTVAAAYAVSRSHGNRARERVLSTIALPRETLAPELQRHLSEAAKKLSEELPRGRAAWRWEAMFRAGRLLLQVGVNDQAASMAYFSVLSMFPLVALAIFALALFLDEMTIRSMLEDLGTHYLPASAGLFGELVGGLQDSYTALGLLSVAGLVIVGNGLFMAVNRAIKRVFGEESHLSFRGNLAEALLIAALGLALLVSIGMSAFLLIILGAGAESVPMLGNSSYVIRWTLGTIAALAPAVVTGLVFIFLYHRLPHSHVELRDAAYGGIIALMLFETGKHLFLWLTGMAAARLVVYGPIASAVVLLMWAYYAGIIFLYGAALTRIAGELRPKSGRHAGSRHNVTPGGRE